MPAPDTLCYRRCLLLVLLVGGLGACQRAGYQFQAVENTATPTIAPASAAESAVLTIALPPAVCPDVTHLPKTYRHQRPAARPPRLRRAAPAPLPRRAVVAGRAARAPRPRQEPAIEPARRRSRTIAIILATLSLIYLPLSLHNFYLGYYGRGAASVGLAMVGSYLVLLGLLTSLFSGGGGMVGLGLVGLAMLGVWFVWQLTDFIRIISGDLQPKDGEYASRLAKPKPNADKSLSPRTD